MPSWQAAMTSNARFMQELFHNTRRRCDNFATDITSSDRRRKKFRKFHTSMHKMNMSMITEVLCIVCNRQPPPPPQFQCWTRAKMVRELAKFLPLKRPRPAAHSQGQHLNIEIGGTRGACLFLCLRVCVHLFYLRNFFRRQSPPSA